MAPKSMRAQALILTSANLFVRMTGFLMRIIFTRLMGAEAIGIMELAASAHMIAITPSTAGLPLAVSRLTAKNNKSQKPLQAGRWLVNRFACFLIPLYLLLTPSIARALGDARTWPSLIFTAPCIWILGHSAVLNGYCYGTRQPMPPALSEMLEQCLRFIITISLLLSFPGLSVSWQAAVPPFATMCAEWLGLLLVLRMLKMPRGNPPDLDSIKKTARLSAPPTLSRLCTTGLRSLTAILIPLQLRASGLSASEATARLGMLNGMAMPLVMLPSVFTSAVAMLATPALASKEHDPKALRNRSFKILVLTLAISFFSAAALYWSAPTIALKLYRQPDLIALLRLLCPSVIMSGLSQVINGMIAGVGKQKSALYASILGAGLTLWLTWLLTVQPDLRQIGSAQAMMAGQVLSLGINTIILFKSIFKHPDDRSAAIQA